MDSGEVPPAASQVTGLVTVPPGSTEPGLTSASGSANAADAVAPRAAPAKAVAYRTRAVRRMSGAPSEGLRSEGHGRRAPRDPSEPAGPPGANGRAPFA